MKPIQTLAYIKVPFWYAVTALSVMRFCRMLASFREFVLPCAIALFFHVKSHNKYHIYFKNASFKIVINQSRCFPTHNNSSIIHIFLENLVYDFWKLIHLIKRIWYTGRAKKKCPMNRRFFFFFKYENNKIWNNYEDHHVEQSFMCLRIFPCEFEIIAVTTPSIFIKSEIFVFLYWY